MGARGPLPGGSAAKPPAANAGKRGPGRRGSKIEAALPERPSDLSPDAAAEWDRIVPVLHLAGLLTVLDRSSLVAYCSAVGRHSAARRDIDERGSVLREPIQSSRGDVIGFRDRQNPSVAIERETAKLLVQLNRGFGLTPADRQRLVEASAEVQATSETNAVIAIRERLKEHRQA